MEDVIDLYEDEDDEIELSPPVHAIQTRQGPPALRWLSFKDTIVELYAKNRRNWKLWEVQQFMEEEHRFHASKKQYKDKLKDWGVRKNKQHRAPTTVRRRRRTSSTSTYSTATVDGELMSNNSVVSAFVTTLSTRMLKGHRTLTNLVYYLESRLFSGGVVHFFGPLHHWHKPHTGVMPLFFCHPSHLNSNYSRAMVLTRNNCPKPALALFSHTSDVMESLFTGHHPALTPCILDAFIENVYETNPRSRTTMVEQAIHVAERTLGHSHPITELCRLLQIPLDNEEEVDHLLWFCDRLCKVFSDQLGITHKISIYVNLRYFEKLLQMKRLTMAQEHLQNAVEPCFTSLMRQTKMPDGMKAACLCYLRRKAHLFRALGKYADALTTLHRSIRLVACWLDGIENAIAGNPIIEETFRLLDEYSHLLHDLKDILRAVDLHAFSLELCIAVRGENDGKTMRMVAGHARFCRDVDLLAQEAALRMRFPEVFADVRPDNEYITSHKWPCANCGNGQDTQNFCEAHRQVSEVSARDRTSIQCIKERLECLAQATTKIDLPTCS